MKKGFYLALFFTGWLPLNVWATLAPTATFTDSNGTEKTVSSTDPTEKVEGDAPLLVRFMKLHATKKIRSSHSQSLVRPLLHSMSV